MTNGLGTCTAAAATAVPVRCHSRGRWCDRDSCRSNGRRSQGTALRIPSGQVQGLRREQDKNRANNEPCFNSLILTYQTITSETIIDEAKSNGIMSIIYCYDGQYRPHNMPAMIMVMMMMMWRRRRRRMMVVIVGFFFSLCIRQNKCIRKIQTANEIYGKKRTV